VLYNPTLKIETMKTLKLLSAALFSIALLTGVTSFAQGKSMNEQTVMVGGAAMYPSKNIVENAVNSKDHTTLVAAVQAAELVDVLKGDGPFTVFAPTNAAFDKLPAGSVETLLKPENKKLLQTILTYHVVAGKYSATDIVKAIKVGKGQASFTTVSGGELMAMLQGKDVILKDEKGNTSMVTISDVNQSNGVIHVIDSVVLPSDGK
jgi:uncharacterized surface protein with fasciclin (FAS1) repeats